MSKHFFSSAGSDYDYLTCMQGTQLILLGIVVAVSVGCMSSREVDPEASRASRRLAGATGEADEGSARESDAEGQSAELDLEPLEYEFDVDVPAGAELFKCIYAQTPTDRATAVASAESHYTPGSHHLLAYRTSLREIPAGSEGAFDCDDGAINFVQRGSYYEAQQPDERRDLPPGIAHKFEPGEVILIQSHYINPSEEDIAANVQLILHQTDPETVEQEAGTLFFNNVRLQIPPRSKVKVTMTCPLSDDIHPGLLWSHMHKRGVRFTATTDDAEAAEVLGTLYESSDWAEPQPREYPTDVVLHAGTNIIYSCEYDNDSDIAYRFGESAEHNEMCILHGMYWPRMAGFGENCLSGFRSATSEMLE
jgi:Copper type II ascorbate-dependent monooxygenase, C-terminal domain